MKMTTTACLDRAFVSDQRDLLLAAVQAIHDCETADRSMTFLSEYGKDAMGRLFELYCACRKAEPDFAEIDFNISSILTILRHFASETLLQTCPSHTLLGIYREATALLKSLSDGGWFA